MKKYIKTKDKIYPSLAKGRLIKVNGTKYLCENLVGYGEHRFVFQLINVKDHCSLFNLLVFRKKESFDFVKTETLMPGTRKHKQMKMYYLKEMNCALRERYDIYEMLSDEKLLTKIHASLYQCLTIGDYEQAIALLNGVKKNSYVLVLLSYCYKMLGDKKYLYCLKKLKKRDTNFDFENLLRIWTEHYEK